MIKIDADYENGWTVPIRHSIRNLIKGMERDSSYKHSCEHLNNCLYHHIHDTDTIHLEYMIDCSD